MFHEYHFFVLVYFKDILHYLIGLRLFEIILQRPSYSVYCFFKISFVRYAFLFAINKYETTLIADLKEDPRNQMNSGLVCPVEPSAIFNTTESAAFQIWLERLNNSKEGK